MVGSTWRKWDLHIHTPDTVLNNQFTATEGEDVWETYLKKIEGLNDIAVLGVTEYFSIEPYKKLLSFKKAGRIPNVDLLIPNVELRIVPVTRTDTPINLHLLFAPDVVDDLDSMLFSQLRFQYDGRPYQCTRHDLIRLGRAFKSNLHLEEGQPIEKV